MDKAERRLELRRKGLALLALLADRGGRVNRREMADLCREVGYDPRAWAGYVTRPRHSGCLVREGDMVTFSEGGRRWHERHAAMA